MTIENMAPVGGFLAQPHTDDQIVELDAGQVDDVAGGFLQFAIAAGEALGIGAEASAGIGLAAAAVGIGATVGAVIGFGVGTLVHFADKVTHSA